MRTGPRVVPSGSEDPDKGVGFINDPRRYPYFRHKNSNRSRPKRKKLSDQSLLQEVGSLWSGLSSSEKADWNSAGSNMNLSGYQLFTQDTSHRIKEGLSYPSTPSDFYQTWVGHVSMNDIFGGVLLDQEHPSKYFLKVPVEGKRGLTKEIKITEDPASEIQVKFNYKSDVSASGVNDRLQLQSIVRYPDSIEVYQELGEFDLPYSTGWTSFDETITLEAYPIDFYVIRFFFYSLTGDFWFDNIEIIHTGKNWAYSPYLQNIEDEYQELPSGYIWPQWRTTDAPGYFTFRSEFYD